MNSAQGHDLAPILGDLSLIEKNEIKPPLGLAGNYYSFSPKTGVKPSGLDSTLRIKTFSETLNKVKS